MLMIAGSHHYAGQFLLQEAHFRGLPCQAIHQVQDLVFGGAHKLSTSTQEQRVLLSAYGSSRFHSASQEMQINYQLLEEAQKKGVTKVVFLLPLFSSHRCLNRVRREQAAFCKAVEHSSLNYLIIKVNYLYSDLNAWLYEAEKGSLRIFSWGHFRLNPIHGEDLAQFVFDHLEENQKTISLGGPEVLSQMEIAKMALSAQHKEQNIKQWPSWLRTWEAFLHRLWYTSEKHRPWLQEVKRLDQHLVARREGIHRLKAYFRDEAQRLQPVKI